jgi:hypothetical protein
MNRARFVEGVRVHRMNRTIIENIDTVGRSFSSELVLEGFDGGEAGIRPVLRTRSATESNAHPARRAQNTV